MKHHDVMLLKKMGVCFSSWLIIIIMTLIKKLKFQSDILKEMVRRWREEEEESIEVHYFLSINILLSFYK